MMAPGFKDPSRITTDGKGEDEPIGDNATPEGRATNRRVDVMIPKEETL
jgi:type VI secretion system protein ImpK